MIVVYFESGIHAEIGAVFPNDETYMLCLPALEKYAKENRMFITESDLEGNNLDNINFDLLSEYSDSIPENMEYICHNEMDLEIWRGEDGVEY